MFAKVVRLLPDTRRITLKLEVPYYWTKEQKRDSRFRVNVNPVNVVAAEEIEKLLMLDVLAGERVGMYHHLLRLGMGLNGYKR